MADFIATTGPLEIELSSYLVMEDVRINRAQIWWNHSYIYRRATKIEVNPDEGLPSGHSASFLLPKTVLSQNKIRIDRQDIEVAYLRSSVPESWQLIGRSIEDFAEYYKITFTIQEAIAPGSTCSDYYIYYGNPELKNRPERPAPDFSMWFITEEYDSNKITYTRPGEHWIDGESNVTGARATYKFWGPEFRVFMDKGPSCGFVGITIDDVHEYLVDLFSFDDEVSSLVFRALDLGSGEHRVELRVAGEKNPVSSGFSVKLSKIESDYHSIISDVAEQHDEALFWGGSVAGV